MRNWVIDGFCITRMGCRYGLLIAQPSLRLLAHHLMACVAPGSHPHEAAASPSGGRRGGGPRRVL